MRIAVKSEAVAENLKVENKESEQPVIAHPSFATAFKFWLKLGLISFGGPAGQISIMHHELVDQKRWVSNERFLNALNYCMLLPGPEAQQLATYIGWLLHRLPGGIVAGAFFVIPSIFILFALSYVYAAYGTVPWVAAVFNGLKAAIMAIVMAAVIKIGKKALKNAVMAAIAALSFIAIFIFKIPFPLIVLGAGLLGLAGRYVLPAKFDVIRGKDARDFDAGYVQICEDPEVCHINPSIRRNIVLVVVFLLLWLIPVIALYALLPQRVFYTEALFFTKAAFLTFGGAYAVLAYIAQAGVEQYAWLTGPQMIDGLGLAETTPGPLIMVVQFVGFMAGWNHAAGWNPIVGGLVGSLVATYFTFLPCFLFVFLGGPYIEKFRDNATLSAALSSITAAVVGVVLNLAVWFGLQVLVPADGGFNGFAAVIGLAAFIAIQWFKVGIMTVIFAAGAIGFIWHQFVI
ncbi:MAG: chromate efflux transporter [Deltaproteobacteria bacterium]|jgi:chromate transporter|nr:chromate efflux transporter [Deltaproteobacteria bacterium]